MAQDRYSPWWCTEGSQTCLAWVQMKSVVAPCTGAAHAAMGQENTPPSSAEGSSGPDSHQPGLSPTEGDIPPTPQLLTAASRRTTEVSSARRGQWTAALPHGPQSTPLPLHLEYVKQAFVPSSVP